MVSIRFARIVMALIASWLLQACGTDAQSTGKGGLRLSVPTNVAYDEARIELNGASRSFSDAGSGGLAIDDLDAGPTHVRVALLSGGSVVSEGVAETVVEADSVASVAVETRPITAGARAIEITRLDEQ